MNVNAVFPVLMTERLAESRDFYTRLLDLRVVFEADWYVQLLSRTTPAAQLGLVASGHASIPERFRGATPAGVLVTIEVDDVDAVHARAGELPIELSLRDEEWGQRHFITRDPDGVAVDIVQIIAVTSPEVAAQYESDVLPS